MSEKREDKTNQAIMESIGCEVKSKSDDDEEKELTLPGFRFYPTDEELVGFYLTRKVQNKRIKIDLIKEVDIYKHDPWDLPKLMSKVGDSKEWYFFSMRGRKYKNSVRPNRVTGSGFWKATGIDKPVYSQSTNECIGLKKSLVYYRGSAGKGTKTDWMMHEFRLPPIWKATSNGQQLPTPKNIIIPEAEVWTLCRIFKRISNYKRFTSDLKQQQQPVVKQSFGDASSKACSLQSEISDDHSNNVTNFKKMEFPQKNIITASSGGNLNYQVDQRNSNYYYNNSQPITTMPQSSFTSSSNSSFWNTSTAEDQEYLFSDGNWDELKSVVDLAIDPRSLFGFK